MFELEKSLCDTYNGLDPIRLLDYPAEDVFNLIFELVKYNERHDNEENKPNKNGVIRKKANDNWF